VTAVAPALSEVSTFPAKCQKRKHKDDIDDSVVCIFAHENIGSFEVPLSTPCLKYPKQEQAQTYQNYAEEFDRLRDHEKSLIIILAFLGPANQITYWSAPARHARTGAPMASL